MDACSSKFKAWLVDTENKIVVIDLLSNKYTEI